MGKRLAQCLNPALPTGVHQRALDVYAHVLSVLGVSFVYPLSSYNMQLISATLQSDGLQRDLQIWSSGLFPFFAYSATSVRVSSGGIASSSCADCILLSPRCSIYMTRFTSLYKQHYAPS